jgi:anaerobic ribonucleoside-triphosphate reductase activating protein
MSAGADEEEEADVLDVALVVPRTEAEGPGTRFAVWVQGCPMRCPGCCNPEMLPFRVGPIPAESSYRPCDLARQAIAAGVEGVSLLGGEPFAQARGLAALAAQVREAGLSVMVFSGYTLAELRAAGDPAVATLLARTDLLVDGRYKASRRTTSRRWIGSDNQVLHFLTDRYAPDDPRFAGPNHLEIRVRRGVVTVNGFPIMGARKIG